MKTLKNDTRYIIKRVIIGVLIAILLFNARKCGVYAQTIELSNISASNNCSPLNLIYNYDIGTYSRWSCASTSFQVSRTLSYSNTTLFYDTYNIKNYANVGNSTYNIKYFILYDSTNDYYIIQNTNTNNYSTNTLVFNSVNNYIDLHFGNTGSLVPSTIISDYSMTFTSDNNTYTLSNYNNEIFSYNLGKISLLDLDLSHTYIYDTNIEGLSLIIDNQIIQEYSSFPPTGYQEINLSDYQGVIFVPKNYSTMNYNDLYNLDFNYYYKGRVRDGYFLLNNSNQHYYNTNILISDDDFTERNSFYTLARVLTTEGITTTTTIEYSAFVVYNSSSTGTWEGDILPIYGETILYYDSTLYDYYLVEDFNTFNQNICFYDFENIQFCINVKSLPTLLDILDTANDSTTKEQIPQQRINYILEFLKMPFRMLRDVSTGTCQSFSLPIPIIGGTIQLNCLSGLYENVLGNGYTFLRLIINGLLLYRITLHNIKVFKDVLDPSNTGIEVVNL